MRRSTSFFLLACVALDATCLFSQEMRMVNSGAVVTAASPPTTTGSLCGAKAESASSTKNCSIGINPPVRKEELASSSTGDATYNGRSMAAGSTAITDYGAVCSGSFMAGQIAQDVYAYAAQAKVNSSSALIDAKLQAAIDAAAHYGTQLTKGGVYESSFIGPSIEGTNADENNLDQGNILFPQGQICAVSADVNVPVGMGIKGNHSVLVQISTKGNGLVFADVVPGTAAYPNGKYGRNGDRVEDLILIGPGSSKSTGTAFSVNTANRMYVTDVAAFGFHHALDLFEVEYSDFFGFWGSHNGKGVVIGKGLQRSIENNFFGGGFERNDDENVWIPDGIRNRFYGTSLSFAGHLPVLVGPQPSPYVSTTGYKLTTGGAGCLATIVTAASPALSHSTSGLNAATLAIAPLVIRGSGTGAAGFAVVSAGRVVGVYGVKSGSGYSTSSGVTVTVPTCSVQPVINAMVIDEQLGETQGIGGLSAETGIGSNVFDANDVEQEAYFADDNTPNKPAFGYAFAFMGNTSDDILRDISMGSGNSAPEFYQMIYTAGQHLKVQDSSLHVMNPLTGSLCSVTQTANNAVNIRSLSNPIGSLCDSSDKPIVDNGAANSIGFYRGTISGMGYTAWSTSQYNPVVSARIYQNTDPSGTSIATPWFVDFANGQREYADGTGRSAPDLVTQRGTDLLGAAFTLSLGHTNLSTNVISGPVLAFATQFYSTGKIAVFPNVGSGPVLAGSPAAVVGDTGIPAGQVCQSFHRWDGGGVNGTLSSMTFVATATCNNVDGRGVSFYRSSGKTIGLEQWSASPVTAAVGASQVIAPKGICYMPYVTLFSQDGHATFCPSNGGTWIQKY